MTLPIRPDAPNTPYMKNGHLVVDTPALDQSGHVPTHRLDQASNKLPGESWQGYQQRVLARRSFSPDTARISSLSALDPDVADSTRSLLRDAEANGIHLTPAETKRSQERQEMLFQKGRSAPGDVATWTLTSDHTPGRAVDFDGNSSAMNWLQSHAPTHGFGVMGAMDPGHVSMPTAPAQQPPNASPARLPGAVVMAQPPAASPDFSDVRSGSSTAPAAPDPVADYLAEKQKSQNVNSATGHISDPVSEYLAAKNAHADTPAEPTPRSAISNALSTVDNALTMGLGQKFNAAFNAVGDKLRGRDTFGHSYTTNLAAEHQGIDDFRNEHPIASGVAAGIGGVIPSLVAGPEAEAGVIAKALPMGKRIAGGAKVGAGLGAVNALGNSQNTSSVGNQFTTAAKGGIEGGIVGGAMTAGAEVGGLGKRIHNAKPLDEHAVALDDANTVANKANYGKAIEEGKQTPTTPIVQKAIEHPDIKPYVDMYRQSTTGKGSTDAEALRNAYKGLSREQMRLEEAQKAKQGGYDYAAELKVGDIKAAKKVIKTALGSPSEHPTFVPAVETAQSPPPDLRDAINNFHAVKGVAAKRTEGTVEQQMARRALERHDAEQVASPSLRGAPPAAQVPPAMPSFPGAVSAKAQMERSAEMMREGADAGLREIRGTPVAGKKLTKTTRAAYLRDVGKMTPRDAEDALPGVLGRAKEFVGPNTDIKSGFGLGPSLRALRVSPLVKALDQQAGKPQAKAPFLSGSIVGGTQSLEDLLKNVLGTAGTP